MKYIKIRTDLLQDIERFNLTLAECGVLFKAMLKYADGEPIQRDDFTGNLWRIWPIALSKMSVGIETTMEAGEENE